MGGRTMSMTLIVAVVALAAPGATVAQPVRARNRGPVSVVLDGGLAAGSPGAGPAIGTRLTFDLNDRVGIEGVGAWAGQRGGSDAASLVASLLVNLAGADRTAVPYVSIGGGFSGAMFGMADRQFGRIGDRGGMRQGHTGSRRRQARPDGQGAMHGFSDPAISVGGGVRMAITERVYFRPEVRAVVLFADGRSAATGLFTIGLGYRF